MNEGSCKRKEIKKEEETSKTTGRRSILELVERIGGAAVSEKIGGVVVEEGETREFCGR